MLQDINEDDSKAAFGCQGAELSIWDVATQQISFLAKGAKPNRVGLMDLPANTAVTFIPGSEAAKVYLTVQHSVQITLMFSCQSLQLITDLHT